MNGAIFQVNSLLFLEVYSAYWINKFLKILKTIVHNKPR